MLNKTPQRKLDMNTRYRERNREAILYHKRNARLRRFGLEPSDLDRMLLEQNNQCAICGLTLIRDGRQTNSAHIDHCHSCGALRKLLCKRCNTMLGFIESNEDNFFKAMDYYVAHYVRHPAYNTIDMEHT